MVKYNGVDKCWEGIIRERRTCVPTQRTAAVMPRREEERKEE